MDLFQDYFIEALTKVQSYVYKPPGYSGLFLKDNCGLAYAYFSKITPLERPIPNDYIIALSKVHQLFHSIQEGYSKPCGISTFINQDPANLLQKPKKSRFQNTERPTQSKRGAWASTFNIVTTTSNRDDKDDVSDEIMTNCFNITKPMYLIALLRLRKYNRLTSPLQELPLLVLANSVQKLEEIIIQNVGPLNTLKAIKEYAHRREDFVIHRDEILLHSRPKTIVIDSYILPKTRPVLKLETWLWAAILCSLRDKSNIQYIKKFFLSDFWKTIQNEEDIPAFNSVNFFSRTLSEFYPLIKAHFTFDVFAEVMLKLFDPTATSSSKYHNRPLFQAIGKNVLNPSKLFDTNSTKDWFFGKMPYYQPNMFYFNDKMFIGMCMENNVTVCRVSSYECEDSYWKEEFSEQKKTISQLSKEKNIPASVYHMITNHDASNPFVAACRLVRSLMEPIYEELFSYLPSHYPRNDNDLLVKDRQFLEDQIKNSEVNLKLLAEQIQIRLCTNLVKIITPKIIPLFTITDKAWLYYNKDKFIILGAKESVSNSTSLLNLLNNKDIQVSHVWSTERQITFLNTALCLKIALTMLAGDITHYRHVIQQTYRAPVWYLINLAIEYMLNNDTCIGNIRIISNLSHLSHHYLTEIDTALSFPFILYNIFHGVYYQKFCDSSKGDMCLQFIVSKDCNVIPIPGGYVMRDKHGQITFMRSNLTNIKDNYIASLTGGMTYDADAEYVLKTQNGSHIRLFVKILYDIRPTFFTVDRLNSFFFWANIYDEKYQNVILQVGDISSTMRSIVQNEKSVCGYDGEFLSHFVSTMYQEKYAYQILYGETALYLDFENKLLLVKPDLSTEYGFMHLSDIFMLLTLTRMDIVFRYFINDDKINDVSFVMIHCDEVEMKKILWPVYQDSIKELLERFENVHMLPSLKSKYQDRYTSMREDKSSVCFLLHNNKLKKLHDKMFNFYRQYSKTAEIHRFLSNNSSSWKKNILSPSLIPNLKLYIPGVESFYPSESERILITKSKEAFDQLFRNGRYKQ